MATTQQVDEPDKNVPNPTGKGGFGDNPQNRNPGGWKPETTISYQYRRFLAMPIEELIAWEKTVDKKDRTAAMDIAYAQVIASRKSLPHVKEITDRTEGKAPQYIEQRTDHTTNGESINAPTSDIVNRFLKHVKEDIDEQAKSNS